MNPLWTYFLGLLSGFLLTGLFSLCRFLIDLRITRRRSAQLTELWASGRPEDEQAWQKVRACRKRLRLNPNPNPDWFTPLQQELPQLVKDIAQLYHPEAPDPLQAPRLSEFARAMQMLSEDIATLLQSKRVGRLIDVSAGQSLRMVQTGKKMWKHPHLRKVRDGYERVKPLRKFGQPLLQALRWRSPIMWLHLGASNAAVRTLQPAMVTLVARRAIELYSGRLSADPRLMLPTAEDEKSDSSSPSTS